ncbi:MAG: phosphoenolpyruvate carboxykinase (ATP) [Leptolyngbya sp. PLA3]|nr:MAG: phosphoenolpyruvate carboxykinase (ATP) [Cyanobacteria bacterium CYA]MCE7967994.1 phosphoenolpyruvate carboxykinase (ATP) [Leptolyngbya sp. PL-A3]
MRLDTLLDLSREHALVNLSTAELVERSLRAGEGTLAANGALVCGTGSRTGRSPADKLLSDDEAVREKIWWGAVNKPLERSKFDRAVEIATEYLNGLEHAYVFEGFAGADLRHRLGVRVVSGMAWHSLFSQTLFIKPGSASDAGDGSWRHDWTILAAGNRELTGAEQAELGLKSPVLIAQSLERRVVVILGTQYAGEIKKSIFYAMNHDMPEQGVLPMHCSCNVDRKDPSNVALFFGLSGTGKTTLSADPDRALIGDDEHGWGPGGIFNFEGGCYAKCIRLSREGEPQIWDAIRFGSVLENVVINPQTRVPDYDDGSLTENTRVTYPVDFIPGAIIPSVCTHARNVIFLTADAFGVLPPVSRLTPRQAMYYFINGYTSKLAGTEAGVTEPQPNFSPCFGGPFLPRRPSEYAGMLADRIEEHSANVWLLNTGWTGGPYGVGQRFSLKYTRRMVSEILAGKLAHADFETDEVFGLHIPRQVDGVPSDMLHARSTWKNKKAYHEQAVKLASLFRANAAKFEIPADVLAAGPQG